MKRHAQKAKAGVNTSAAACLCVGHGHRKFFAVHADRSPCCYSYSLILWGFSSYSLTADVLLLGEEKLPRNYPGCDILTKARIDVLTGDGSYHVTFSIMSK